MTPAHPRRILHLDMDAFYASVEQRDRPELRGRPVLVGSDRPRGVVAAASYEARAFGCRSAMPTARALGLCPDAAVVAPRFERYVEASRRVFAVLERYAPVVQPVSIDEAFLDLTGTERLLGPAADVARALKRDVRAATSLTASVGIAPNRLLAKIASDLRKPDGLEVIEEGDVDRVLLPLPVERLWGVGPVTAERLHGMGVRTVGDLRAVPPARLRARFGAAGEDLRRLARGIDDSPVVPDREAKSVGHEETFEVDLPEPEEVRAVLREQAEAVGRRLRRHGLRAGGVSLKIRFGDYETISRSAVLPEPADAAQALRDAALAVFDRWAAEGFRPVRLIGMAAQHLTGGGGQGALFADPGAARRRDIDRALDEIRDRFGDRTIRRGVPRPGE